MSDPEDRTRKQLRELRAENEWLNNLMQRWMKLEAKERHRAANAEQRIEHLEKRFGYLEGDWERRNHIIESQAERIEQLEGAGRLVLATYPTRHIGARGFEKAIESLEQALASEADK